MKLIEALQRTRAKEVSVKYSQVAQLLGSERAKELALGVMGLKQTKNKRLKQRSSIRISDLGLATYNRRELIYELQRVNSPPSTEHQPEGDSGEQGATI